jgi:4-hydroxy-tetrahydrodipicolinate synthase
MTIPKSPKSTKNAGPATPPPGIIGAVLTPFVPGSATSYAVDHDRLADQIELMVGHCDAVSVLGAEVSEYRVLTPAVRREVLRTSIQAVAGRVPVLAGSSSSSVAEVVELAELAAEAGAEFAQVLIPTAAAGTVPLPGDLVTYFEEVARRSPIPIVAYHNPPSGADPAPATLVEIAQVDGVVAFKESSRDITKIGRLVEEIELAGHARYYTTMQALLPTLEVGGSGAMMPPPGTLIGAQVYAAFARGDRETAARWQGCFRTYPARWSRYGLGGVSKAGMQAIGHDLGGPAWPFTGMPEAEVAELTEALRGFGVLDLLAETAAAQVG